MSHPPLDRLLQADTLPAVCLLASSEPLLLQEAADRLRARCRELGYAERDILDVDGRFDWSSLGGAASAMSLFSARRLVELRLPTGKPGTEGSNAIRKYCDSPAPDTLLLVLAAEWSNKHDGAWSKAIARSGFSFSIPSLRLEQLPAWIRQRMQSRGLHAHNDAVQLLAERSEGNLLAAAQEIDKLALLLTPSGWTEADGLIKVDTSRMEQLVADSARFDPFALIDVAIGGDIARSLRMLRSLRGEGAVVYQLLGPINHALATLAQLAEVQAAGGNLAQAMQQSRLWESKQTLYRRCLGRAAPSHWQRVLADLGRVDRMSKGREYGDAWLGLERLLVSIAEPESGIRAKAS